MHTDFWKAKAAKPIVKRNEKNSHFYWLPLEVSFGKAKEVLSVLFWEERKEKLVGEIRQKGEIICGVRWGKNEEVCG